MSQTRNFQCHYNGGACDDPNCTVGYCAQQHEDRVRAGFAKPTATPAGQLQRERDEIAEKFAREILKARRQKATPQLIAKLIKTPEVIAEAQRRLDWMRSFNLRRRVSRKRGP
jgi:hypothetical protein